LALFITSGSSFVYASSVGAYSPGPKDRRVGETWPTGGIPSSFYSRHKVEVERMLDRFEGERPATRVVRLRPGLIFQRDAASEIRRLFAGPFLPSPLVRPGRVPMVPGIPGLRFHQVQVSAYPLFRYPPYDLALATRLLEVREEAHVDVFHVHYAIPHAVSAFLARSMCGKCFRFVTTLHGTDITVAGSDRAYMRPTRFAIDQSDAVTAVSQYLADETRLVFGVTLPIHVIPNFVDPERFRPGPGKRFTDGHRRASHPMPAP